MTQTISHEAMPPANDAEHYTSAEVYARVMDQALGLSLHNSEPSNLRDVMYQMVTPVALERLPMVSYGHRLLDSDQTTQRGGSYKVRGATHALAMALRADPNLTDVHICSAGNAATGALVACNAYVEGLRLTVECVEDASAVKVDALRVGGAIVHPVHTRFGDGQKAARQQGAQPGHAVIEAFDQIETIAGQSTIGWETLEDLQAQAARGEIDLHTTPIKLFVPVGGGGLISGIACVMRWAKDAGMVGENVQVYGVQMEGCDAMKRYVDCVRLGGTPGDLFEEGLPFNPKSDGTAVLEPGLLTRAVVADPRFVAGIYGVSEGELGIAMADLTKSHSRNIEPAGALALAGARQYMQANPASLRQGPPETIVTFTTGANVSSGLYVHFMDKAATLRRRCKQQEQAELEAYHGRLRNMAGVVLDLENPAPFSGRTGSRVGHSLASLAPAASA